MRQSYYLKECSAENRRKRVFAEDYYSLCVSFAFSFLCAKDKLLKHFFTLS